MLSSFIWGVIVGVFVGLAIANALNKGDWL